MDATATSFGVLWLICMLVSVVFGLLGFVLWIWALIDCVSNEPSEGNDKVIL